MFVAMVIAASAALGLSPQPRTRLSVPDFSSGVPTSFGEWTMVPSALEQVELTTTPNGRLTQDRPYDQVLMRTYVNRRGEEVMLALAYGAKQQQEVKIHRPDLCYAAQGFSIRGRSSAVFDRIRAVSGDPVVGTRMVAIHRDRIEVVGYWIRVGDLRGGSAFENRWHLLAQGLSGRAVDGMLVRASRIVDSEDDEVAGQASIDQFLVDLSAAVTPELRELL